MEKYFAEDINGKLFLCSLNITEQDWKSEETVRIYQDAKEPAGSRFKIIGEISPEATWVKKGDEFAEDEVKIYKPLEFSHYEEYFDTEIQDTSERAVYKNIIRVSIKGACGHFH